MFKSANKTEYIDIVKTLPLYNQEDLFFKYTGYWPEYNKGFYSLFRTDKDPGCRFKWHSGILYFVENAGYNGKLYFNIADIISITQHIGLNDAMLKIVTGNLIANETWEKSTSVTNKQKPEIRFKYDKWEELNYFDLPPNTLYSENVYKVSDYWINTGEGWKMNHLHNPSKVLTIAYYFPETDHTKLYFPEMETFRWYSNCDADVFGEFKLQTYLERNNDLLIITKSQKDRLLLDYKYGYNSIAPQNEGAQFDRLLPTIKQFRQSIILFDPDRTGQEMAAKYSEKYDIPWCNLSISKDVYEAHTLYGYENVKVYLNNLLKNVENY